MKTLTEYINEKLLINKNFKTILLMDEPESLNETDINFAWVNIFDNIHTLKTGNIHLGKILVTSKKDHPKYENDTFILYKNYRGKITIRRGKDNRYAIWCAADNLHELTEKMKKLLKKEQYEIS